MSYEEQGKEPGAKDTRKGQKEGTLATGERKTRKQEVKKGQKRKKGNKSVRKGHRRKRGVKGRTQRNKQIKRELKKMGE